MTISLSDLPPRFQEQATKQILNQSKAKTKKAKETIAVQTQKHNGNLPLRITMPGNPITKKNSSQLLFNPKTKRYFVSPSKQYKAYEKACGKVFLGWENEPIECGVNLKCVYYMQTRRAVDLPNLLNATDDILVKYKVLADDNSKIVCSHDGSYVSYDKENPRVEIIITEADLNATKNRGTE